MIEKSCGGIVIRGSRSAFSVLMVRVKNLEGRILWTFPKGHMEGTESEQETALREVREETGWRCNILPYSKKQERFLKVQYHFFRKGVNTKKEVVWFLMEPVKKEGEKDYEEVLRAGWFSLKRAEKTAGYPSDKKILLKLKGCSRRLPQWFGPRSSATPRRKEKPRH